MLRTHTTSGIPNLLKSIQKEDGIYLLPGIVYRRDVIDKNHVGEPHQLDIWRITKGLKHNRKDLLSLVETIINSILPNVKWRYNETSHYYTLNGIEVEVLIDGNWLEVLECGECHPSLLQDAGLDPNEWSGLAMGIGLDRAVMIKKGIKDIRTLRSQDPRISRQMLNLEPYKEVSNYPCQVSDLSISINKSIDSELLGDMVRRLMIDSSMIEEITIRSETEYEKLPDHVSERLGMTSDMKNILIRLVIRSLDKTMTKDEVNSISKHLYHGLHEGTKGYL